MPIRQVVSSRDLVWPNAIPVSRLLSLRSGDRMTELRSVRAAQAEELQNSKEIGRTSANPVKIPGKGLLINNTTGPLAKSREGSSGINHMAYVRGLKGLLTCGGEFGARSWGWKDILPLFIRAERNRNYLLGKDCRRLDMDESSRQDGPLGVSSNSRTYPTSLCQGAQQKCHSRGDYNSGDMENKTIIFQQTISGRSPC
jgi:choline dehydrogenase-like flavoprotein